ncbi:MAG: glycosyl hydrolase [Planctomycetota bacterium]
MKKLSGLLCVFLFLISTASLMAQEKAEEKNETGITSGLLSALKLRSIGPAFMSGRISDLAVDSNNPNHWYVGVGSGNVWKTTNAGTTFEPIFENYSSYSIGCITIDPSNSSTVWVGTGENVAGRHVGYGDGVYVSHDAGKTFKNSGLKESEHISKIIVHPNDSNTIFVASQGPLWSPGGQRGLFKSTDGGKTWKCVLSKGEFTGATDVAMDPKNPSILYAAMHQRHRTVWALLDTGPESGIYKSTDGGENWTELKSGLPGGDKGKMAIQVSPQKSNVVYAAIELPDRKGGFYRSDNFGQTWQKMSDYVAGGTGPHYYQEIYCDPHRFDVVYHANVRLGRTQDGGKTFESVSRSTKHVDNHAVAFSPIDDQFLLVGCDGGLYKSYDNAASYQFCGNLPLTQFYKVDVDYDYPFYHVVGGTQDNNTQYGPTRTGNIQGIANSDWRITIGGDGHDNAIDPEDPNIIYCESQEGYIRRFDRKTGQSVDVRPRPGAGEKDFRFNWDSPILISPHDHKRVYFGSKHLHRSDDRGDSWRKVSPDLSRNINRHELKIMGRVWGIDAGMDLYAMSQYGNITSISESPVVEGLLYVGTDDGLIQVSEDSGENWRKVDQIFGVPEYFFVNDIKADKHDPDTVYACVDDHKTGDYQPYLIKSTDRGRTWTSMVGDLPDRHLIWRLEQDHVNPKLFFLGTEYGLYCSINAGENWLKMSAGAPTIPFRDLAIQKRENDLVGATFGRGFYVLDDYSPLRELNDELIKENELYLFPVRKTLWYMPEDKLGGRKGWQGDSFFIASNPDHGATFTYYVRDEFKSKKQIRKEKESKAAKAGSDVPIPTYEELEAESNEDIPRIYFEITNQSGDIVARVNATTAKGLHRTTWNMQQAGMTRFGGPLVPPGQYSAQAIKVHGGEMKKLGNAQNFELVSIVDSSLEEQDYIAKTKYLGKIAKLQDSIQAVSNSVNQAQERLSEIRTLIQNHPKSDSSLLKTYREVEMALKKLDQSLSGNQMMEDRSEQTVPTVGARVSNVVYGSMRNTYGFTETQKEQIEIAKEEFGAISEQAKKVLEIDMKLFEEQLDDAGIPWTRGRAIPTWK